MWGVGEEWGAGEGVRGDGERRRGRERVTLSNFTA